jgi:hypothetical protein
MTAPLADDHPIPLKDAATKFGFTVSTLRAERRRERLVIFKIGKKDYTTVADIKRMIQLCRDADSRQGSITTKPVAIVLLAYRQDKVPENEIPCCDLQCSQPRRMVGRQEPSRRHCRELPRLRCDTNLSLRSSRPRQAFLCYQSLACRIRPVANGAKGMEAAATSCPR